MKLIQDIKYAFKDREFSKPVRKWLRALDEGKYSQTRGVLHDKDGFCCLGVACDLYIKNSHGLLQWHLVTAMDGTCTFGGPDGNRRSLPTQVKDWLGLKENIGVYYADREFDSLAFHNDNGATFAEIAAIIRSKPAELFQEEK